MLMDKESCNALVEDTKKRIKKKKEEIKILPNRVCRPNNYDLIKCRHCKTYFYRIKQGKSSRKITDGIKGQNVICCGSPKCKKLQQIFHDKKSKEWKKKNV